MKIGKEMLMEFLRYVVVGGIAFLADYGALMGSYELVLKNVARGLYYATAVGFMVGLAVNYFLSLIFVFTAAKDKGKGRSFGAFVVFGIIGLLGLLWTELGMWLGADVCGVDYRIVKIFVTGVVLVWNYLGRKLIIFK